MNSEVIEAMRRESEKRQLSELQVRVDAARDRADNADVAAQAAVELAEAWRKEAEALRAALENIDSLAADGLATDPLAKDGVFYRIRDLASTPAQHAGREDAPAQAQEVSRE